MSPLQFGRAQREFLASKLEEVEGKLKEAKADRRENERERKMRDAVAKMKDSIPGESRFCNVHVSPQRNCVSGVVSARRRFAIPSLLLTPHPTGFPNGVSSGGHAARISATLIITPSAPELLVGSVAHHELRPLTFIVIFCRFRISTQCDWI